MSEEIITVSNFNKKHYMSRLKRIFEKAIFNCKLFNQPCRKEIEKNFKGIIKIISHEITIGDIFKNNYIRTYLQYIEGYIHYLKEYSKVVSKPTIPKSIIDSSTENFLKYQIEFIEQLKHKFIELPTSKSIANN